MVNVQNIEVRSDQCAELSHCHPATHVADSLWRDIGASAIDQAILRQQDQMSSGLKNRG